jgi:RimJ/RimL family protein N-acetyltransferase
VLLSQQFLTTSLHGSHDAASFLAGFRVPDDWFANADFIRLRRDQCLADAAYPPWSVRAIVLRATNEMIGHIGFHEPPNAEHLRKHGPNPVEFGYTIYPPHRRQGYATEAIGALLQYAAEAGVRTFVLSIAPDNIPSQAIARRFGFTKFGEHIDEKDGLEEIFILRATPRTAPPDCHASPKE